MKSIRIHQFGGPEVLKLEELPLPKPAPGEMLVRLKAVGINPVDTYIRAGLYGPRTFPFTPGLDAAGIVELAGSDVRKFKAGERVYLSGSVSGAYAEYALCREDQVHALPDSLSFTQGAALGVPYVTAYFGLVKRAQALPGEILLIHGASGGVGVAAVQTARLLKLKIYGTSGTDKGRGLIREQGALHVLDHRAPGYLDEFMKLTEGKGADIVLEMLANENLGKDLKILAAHGRVIVIGSRGTVSIDPRDTMTRHADIRGMSIVTASAADLAEVHEAIGQGLASGALRPVIGAELSLSQAASAHEQVMKAGAYGKIVLIP